MRQRRGPAAAQARWGSGGECEKLGREGEEVRE
jgi:hypothetical protein